MACTPFWSHPSGHTLLPTQAFNIVIALFHNPITAGLDTLPAGDPNGEPAKQV